jgi:hypothetical protein
MTGVADLYLYLKHNRIEPLLSHLQKIAAKRGKVTNFVILAWKRTGSNLLCGILYNHPEIIMHNELFNTIDIFTYYPELIDQTRWSVLTRDLFPEEFLTELWSSSSSSSSSSRTNIKPVKNSSEIETTKEGKAAAAASRVTKAIGFKSFPEHWTVVRNEKAWSRAILENCNIKKIVLRRDDELAVYVSSMKRGYIWVCHIQKT